MNFEYINDVDFNPMKLMRNPTFQKYELYIRNQYRDRYNVVKFLGLVSYVGSRIKNFCKERNIKLTIDEFMQIFVDVLSKVDPEKIIFVVSKETYRKIRDRVYEEIKVKMFERSYGE